MIIHTKEIRQGKEAREKIAKDRVGEVMSLLEVDLRSTCLEGFEEKKFLPHKALSIHPHAQDQESQSCTMTTNRQA